MIEDRLGVVWYVGQTQTGKTTLAIKHLIADGRATGRSVLVIDNAEATNFMGIPHAPDVPNALYGLYAFPGALVVYTPKDLDDFDKLMAGVRAGKRAHVLIDEARWVMSWRSISKELTRVMRGWRHAELTLRLVSQRVRDIHQDAWACGPTVHVFYTQSMRDLEVIQSEFGFSPEAVRALAVGEHLLYQEGPPHERPAKPPAPETAGGPVGGPSHPGSAEGASGAPATVPGAAANASGRAPAGDRSGADVGTGGAPSRQNPDTPPDASLDAS